MRNFGQMTALEELKESTKESVFASQRSLSELTDTVGSVESLHDILLDLLTETPTLYKVTVAQARRSKDVEEIATLWKETYDFYASLHILWLAMASITGSKDELFTYWGRMVEKLERATAEHYAFHSE